MLNKLLGNPEASIDAEIDSIIAPIGKIVAKLDKLVEKKTVETSDAFKRREEIDREIEANNKIVARAVGLGSRYRDLLGINKPFTDAVPAE